jgi:tRNA nucleotidyltransferase (CCA-adding enzyme)
MNAIAMDKAGNIIDPFGGKSAIENKVIETVGNPDERFGEDALRMLRAVRFLSQLGFSIESKTLESLTKHSQLLMNIAVERKTVEFEKMLQGKDRAKAVSLLVSTGVYQYLPGLGPYRDTLKRFSDKLSVQLDLIEVWVLMLNELELKEKEIDLFLRAWKLPTQKIKYIIHIHRWLQYRISEEWNEASIYHAGLETALNADRIYRVLDTEVQDDSAAIRHIHEGLPIKQRQELNITGNDLMEWLDRKPGPWLRKVLEDVELAVIHRELVNKKEKIKEWLSGYNLK